MATAARAAACKARRSNAEEKIQEEEGIRGDRRVCHAQTKALGKVYFYQGWHDIIIFRIEILKSIKKKLFLKHYLTEKSDGKEKAFIVTKGKAIFKDEKNR